MYASIKGFLPSQYKENERTLAIIIGSCIRHNDPFKRRLKAIFREREDSDIVLMKRARKIIRIRQEIDTVPPTMRSYYNS